jgi:phosphoenolpyruvate carboxykinase (ATP)
MRRSAHLQSNPDPAGEPWMSPKAINNGKCGLGATGFETDGTTYWNLQPPALAMEAIKRDEGTLSNTGALVAMTGKRTGRSPRDKFIVRDELTEKTVHWGKVNLDIDALRAEKLHDRLVEHIQHRDVFVQDVYCGAHPGHQLKVRIITECAWHSLFARQLFIRPAREAIVDFAPDFTVVCAPSCLAEPEADGVNSEAFVVLDFGQKLALIGGTAYAGEIKKSIFTVMNFLLPQRGVLSMHCSANIGSGGDTAVFFGLSGTGKTTLSADPDRRLIGDDEHGWADDGVFNFEGGCYAKVINLSQQYEPQIYHALKFGCVLENVVLDPVTGEPDYKDGSITENTRGGYPLDHIENIVEPSIGGHPRNIVFLTCDAFGVLPPISHLTPEQAMYHFLSGYTAKVAGTEAGITEPQVTFSTCFGAPFMILDPTVYADLLGKKIAEHGSKVWLINTGWTGGPYGVGSRMKLPYTRAMVTAALSGALDPVQSNTDPIFGIAVPQSCPEVPADILNARGTWNDPTAYDQQARKLADLFIKNFEQFTTASAEVKAAGPQV